jgi:hypothetical protein
VIVFLTTAAGHRYALHCCDGCTPALRRFLPDTPLRVTRSPGGIVKRNSCRYCAWCGAALHIPSRCFLHGSQCPEDRPEQSVQAARIAGAVHRLYAELTDAGWEHLAEEVRICGTNGLPWPGGVVTALVTDPHLSDSTI